MRSNFFRENHSRTDRDVVTQNWLRSSNQIPNTVSLTAVTSSAPSFGATPSSAPPKNPFVPFENRFGAAVHTPQPIPTAQNSRNVSNGFSPIGNFSNLLHVYFFLLLKFDYKFLVTFFRLQKPIIIRLYYTNYQIMHQALLLKYYKFRLSHGLASAWAGKLGFLRSSIEFSGTSSGHQLRSGSN